MMVVHTFAREIGLLSLKNPDNFARVAGYFSFKCGMVRGLIPPLSQHLLISVLGVDK
jgi:hypothetical protein